MTSIIYAEHIYNDKVYYGVQVAKIIKGVLFTSPPHFSNYASFLLRASGKDVNDLVDVACIYHKHCTFFERIDTGSMCKCYPVYANGITSYSSYWDTPADYKGREWQYINAGRCLQTMLNSYVLQTITPLGETECLIY